MEIVSNQEGNIVEIDLKLLRVQATKVAKSILKRWNSVVDEEELDSVINLSLAEVLDKYDQSKGASIVTYMYYHLRGNLAKLIDERVNNSELSMETSGLEYYGNIASQDVDYDGIDSESYLDPHEALERKQARKLYNEALESLSELERTLLNMNLEDGLKVQQIARQLKLSRSYLSRIKHQALRKVMFYIANHMEIKDLHHISLIPSDEPARRGKKSRRTHRRVSSAKRVAVSLQKGRR